MYDGYHHVFQISVCFNRISDSIEYVLVQISLESIIMQAFLYTLQRLGEAGIKYSESSV